ncbi:DUF2590 family protein [Gilvimarinus japonicus]|uniref:DUF2590 family protein n=1 Tax=Gilvimarinus japonicus TaxID=1796469 RepID=A0ABV7HN44_9GAMM
MDYVDLLVTDDDLTLGPTTEPVLVSDRASIAQDIKHLVRESGLLVVMLAERDSDKVAVNMRRIETLVENDLRIKPGTARVRRADTQTIYITANTVKFGPVEVYL